MLLDNNLIIAGSISAANAIVGASLNGAGAQTPGITVDIASPALGGNQAFDIGPGEPLRVNINVLTAPTVGALVRYQLVQCSDVSVTTNVEVLAQTDDLPIASLLAGTIVPLFWDRAAPYNPRRYVGFRVFNTGAIATHSVFASIIKDQQDVRNIYGKSGYSVL